MDSIIASHATTQEVGFWPRQFRTSSTPGQFVFDLVFGVLMPVLCFYMDPGIIRGDFPVSFRECSVFIYALSALAIIALVIWLSIGPRRPSVNAIFGGVLLAGAMCSFSIGILILPMTLIGILIVIGLLGLVPFVTAFVYLRNALKAIEASGANHKGSRHAATVVLSVIVVLALPVFAQWRVNAIVTQSMAEIMDQGPANADTAITRIKRFHLPVDTDRILRAYEMESGASRKAKLGRAYKEITGEEPETRLNMRD